MNLDIIKDYMIKYGYSSYKMAKLMGLSHTAFYNKITGKYEFKAYEIRKLKKILNIDDRTMLIILFGESEI